MGRHETTGEVIHENIPSFGTGGYAPRNGDATGLFPFSIGLAKSSVNLTRTGAEARMCTQIYTG